MKKSVKIWLITATALVLAGSIILTGMMTSMKWDFSKLSTVKYETNTHEINEKFKDISVKAVSADINFVTTSEDTISVICTEQEKLWHRVAVRDEALFIEAVDERKWYDHIGINFDNAEITVYLPAGEYGTLSVWTVTGDVIVPECFTFESVDAKISTGDFTLYSSVKDRLKLKTTTGDLLVQNISVGSADLSATTGNIAVYDLLCDGELKISISTGKTTLSKASCKGFVSNGTTGDISISDLIVSEKISVERNTGDIKLTRTDAAELSLKTTTGSIKGNLLTDKIFITNSSTGKVKVPKTTVGGVCEITTSTGNIKIEIAD